MIPGKKYTLEDFLNIAWRRRWLIAVPCVTIAVATAIVTRTFPNQYRSETLIQIVPQRLSESYVRSAINSPIEDRLQSLRQQILNRTRLERLINDFNLYTTWRKSEVMEDIVERMRKDISIEPIRGDAFKVIFISDHAATAMKVTERIGSLIIEENLRDRESLAEGANQFFDTQLDDARRRLVEHEKKLEEYRRQYLGELPSQLESNLQIIQNSQIQIQSLGESINRDRDRRLMLERMIADVTAPAPAPAAVESAGQSSDPTVLGGGRASDQLETAKERLRMMELRFKPVHPDVIAIKRIIRDLEAKVAADPSQTPSAPGGAAATSDRSAAERRVRELTAEMQGLDREIAYKQAETVRLQQTVATYQNRVEATPARESELTALTRDYDTLQKVYTSLLGKKEDSNVAANLERRQIGEQFKVLDPARMPEKAFSPNRLRINFLGALAGLALGIGLTILLEYRDRTLKTDDDVRVSLDLPVLALIPEVRTPREVRQEKLMRFVVGFSLTALFLVAVTVAAWRFGS